MIKLDEDLLQELGLAALPPEEKKKLLAHIYETLEMRVGMKLAERMSDAQLTEFEQFIDRNDEAGALRWLETNFPDYKDVVASEFDLLKKEIAQVAPQIVASGGTGGQAPPPQPGQQPVQPVNLDDPARPQPGETAMWQGDQSTGQPTPWQQPPAQQPPQQGQYPGQQPQQGGPQHPGSRNDYDLAA